MSSIIYMNIKGKKQGLISAGCGTFDSIGNRYQVGHEDDVFFILSALGYSFSAC